MRTFPIVLGLWFLAASTVAAQTSKIQDEVRKSLEQKKLTEDSLAKLLAEALKNNPDIRVADAKVREAEAELSRTRMKIASELTFLQAEIQAAQASVDYARNRADRMAELFRLKSIESSVYDEALLALEKAKAELASKQAKLPYLLGRSAGTSSIAEKIDDHLRKKWADAKDISDEEFLRRATLDILGRLPSASELQKFMSMEAKQRRQQWMDHLQQQGERESLQRRLSELLQRESRHQAVEALWKLHMKPDTPMTEKLRQALDAPIEFKKDSATAKDLMDFVRSNLNGVNMQVRFKSPKKDIAVSLGERIPLGAFLQFVEDETECVFVLRDYGIVVIAADEQAPPGSVRVSEFWKRPRPAPDPLLTPPADEPKTTPKEDKDPNPPSTEIRGSIEKVDSTDRALVSLSVGSAAGLKVGHTLEVFRTAALGAKYLGTLRIVSVTAQKSVGRMVSTTNVPQLQPGDEVASSLAVERSPFRPK